MKRKILSILVVLLSVLFTGCFNANEENPVVESQWKLIETRISIGGEAEYIPADREEFVTFLSDSRVRNSTGWCGEGRETAVTYSQDGTINTNCQNSGKLLFEMEGDYLIIRNPTCIEACDLKYSRVDTGS